MDEIEAISQYFRFFHFGPYTNVVHLDQNGIGDQERLEDATHYYIALMLLNNLSLTLRFEVEMSMSMKRTK